MADEKKDKQAVEEALEAYEKLRQKISKTLGELNEKISTDSISHAMEKAKEELKKAGEHSKESISRASETLKKDITSSISQIKPKMEADVEETRENFQQLYNKGGELWHEISNEAEKITKKSLDKGGEFLVNVTKGLSEWTKNLSDKLDNSLLYKTGEVTHGGEFACMACGAEIKLKKPGRIPPCPKCSKTGFRRA